MTLPPSLIDHIANRRPAIINAWLQALWKSPEFSTPDKIPTPQLVDHLPNLLDDFVDYLQGESVPEAEDHARIHGRYRWEQNFRLDELLREMLVIRGIILGEMEQFLAQNDPSGVAVSLEASRRATRFFDHALLSSASQFSEYQQARRKEDSALMDEQHRSPHIQMEALDAARLRLLRTMSHELRNMLNTATLTTESLFAEKDPKWRTELQEMLKGSHRQMTALVNQLLEMAPLLAKRELLKLAPLDLRVFAAEQSRVFEQMAAIKHLKLRCPVPEGVPEVITDSLKLQRIVTNLVQNALKYTPAGGSVELRFERVDDARWKLSVSDTGPGVSPEHQARIFEEFYRVPGTEHQEGTGLGLSIVRQIVGLMGGEISVESEVGRGSTFTVVLPIDPNKLT